MMEKVSVIIPAYNAGKYIAECLDSVIEQTYKNIEIVIVNDGSTDNTRDVVKDYSARFSNIVSADQENGVVIKRNPNAIYQGLKYLLDNPEECARIAKTPVNGLSDNAEIIREIEKCFEK